MKAINYQKGQEWWEISRNPNPEQARSEEMEEILAETRWWKKLSWESYLENGYQHESRHDSSEDITNFWKKWSEGGHFWYPENQRWYSKKWWMENYRDYQLRTELNENE